ncbi:hypothetical protein, partial [Salmonella enterica]|uniref:hypothetical protein n=1 Tax=Salmonella enterica TaxID=28901 RepID=UPI001C38EAE2
TAKDYTQQCHGFHSQPEAHCRSGLNDRPDKGRFCVVRFRVAPDAFLNPASCLALTHNGFLLTSVVRQLQF